MGKAFIIAAIVVAAALVVALLIYVTHRTVQGQATRRRDNVRLRAQLVHADAALDAVKESADLWKDAESVLATQVRESVNDYERKRRDLGT